MTDDLIVEALDNRAVSQKRQRYREALPQRLGTLPSDWRELLARWVRRGGNSRWETLRNEAGANATQTAQSLLDWLLREGWAVVVEQRAHGGWWPQRVALRNLPTLRAALGIGDRESDARRWQQARADLEKISGGALAPALLALDELPPHRALARHDLIAALQRWQDAQHSGTRRDFALFARGDTKSLTGAEWNWLESTLDLAEFNIERHTPLLLLSAPLTLHFAHGPLDLAACPDFAALTPATTQKMARTEGAVAHWHLIENRTSFERAARQRHPDTGVIWLPGFPPTWWLDAVGRLLDLAPAPALLSCDPDPAGIAIALHAARPWQQRRLDWQPWKMGVEELAGLTARKPLTEQDRLQLLRLLDGDDLPAPLHALAHRMLEQGEKGEQEGFL
jgi:hypothetical protein